MKPGIPFAFICSRSNVIAAGVVSTSIHIQNTHGAADSGGSAKPLDNSPEVTREILVRSECEDPAGNPFRLPSSFLTPRIAPLIRGEAAVTEAAATIRSKNLRLSIRLNPFDKCQQKGKSSRFTKVKKRQAESSPRNSSQSPPSQLHTSSSLLKMPNGRSLR